jgi:coenzyme PQQ precursor peptide PqqA
MQWTKPDFVEITLNMEVTGYVNTDDKVASKDQKTAIKEESENVPSITSDR